LENVGDGSALICVLNRASPTVSLFRAQRIVSEGEGTSKIRVVSEMHCWIEFLSNLDKLHNGTSDVVV